MTKGKTKKHKTAKSGSQRDFLSPFRYPGGKSWFVETACKWLENQRKPPAVLVEPFAGGASISLAAVRKKIVKKAIFCEIDCNVAATWKTILNGGSKWLSNQIRSFRINRREVKKIITNIPQTQRHMAFWCLLRNRTSRGGVIAQGAGLIREGENGQGISSRWYPDTIAKRIKTISKIKANLEFTHGDGLDLIQKHINNRTSALFIDPPYTKAARRLYDHWDINHEDLFRIIAKAKGPVLMTYDDTPEIRELAKKYRFEFRRISMHTSHHENKRELMISKDFNWLGSTTNK